MISSSKISDPFIAQLASDYPRLKFAEGRQDLWSPSSQTVFYNSRRNKDDMKCSLLHELAHALLGHKNYGSDFELLKLESEAWAKAAEIGPKYGVSISDEHIQNCLDTYRDWLHRRSTCPSCGVHVLQKDNRTYKCFNCGEEWSVTSARFVRAYRKTFNKKSLS